MKAVKSHLNNTEVAKSDNKTDNNGRKVFCSLTSDTDMHNNEQGYTMGPSALEVTKCNNQGESCSRMHSSDTKTMDRHSATSNVDQNFDIRNSESDKFSHTIIFNDQNRLIKPTQCVTHHLWCHQSKVKFSFVALTDPIMPNTDQVSDKVIADPIKLHEEVKKLNLPNYLGVHVPVKSQMNIQA